MEKKKREKMVIIISKNEKREREIWNGNGWEMKWKANKIQACRVSAMDKWKKIYF